MKIYLACFPCGKMGVVGYALAENGEGLASHLSSSEEWSKHDMGLTSDWKHEHYAKCFPEGFELIWIDNADSDFRWQEAMKLNEDQRQQEVTRANLEKEGYSVRVELSKE